MKSFIIIPISNIQLVSSLNFFFQKCNAFSIHYWAVSDKINEGFNKKFKKIVILTEDLKNFSVIQDVFKEIKKTCKENKTNENIKLNFNDFRNKIKIFEILKNLVECTGMDLFIATAIKRNSLISILKLLYIYNLHDNVNFKFINCLRQHAKIVKFNDKYVYLGSGNFTGAAIGMRDYPFKKKILNKKYNVRNFELGLQVKNNEKFSKWIDSYINELFSGSFCKTCMKRKNAIKRKTHKDIEKSCIDKLNQLKKDLKNYSPQIYSIKFLQELDEDKFENKNPKTRSIKSGEININNIFNSLNQNEVMIFNHLDKIPYRVLKFIINNAEKELIIYTTFIHPIRLEFNGYKKNIFSIFSELLEKGIKITLHVSNIGKNNFILKKINELKLHPRFSLKNYSFFHAKCIIADNKYCYIGSANLTAAGMGMLDVNKRNLEIGAFLKNSEIIKEVRKITSNFLNQLK